jgi:hypothetical protein
MPEYLVVVTGKNRQGQHGWGNVPMFIPALTKEIIKEVERKAAADMEWDAAVLINLIRLDDDG